MAILKLYKLQLLREAKRLLVGRRAQTAQDQKDLTALAPADIDVAAANLYTPMLSAFDAQIAQVDAQIAGLTLTNADYVAFAQAAETAART